MTDPRTVLLPNVSDFADLLTYEREWDHDYMSHRNGELPAAAADLRPAPRYIPERGETRNEIGPFATIEGAANGPTHRNGAVPARRSIAVTATDLTIQTIAERLVTPDDHIGFKVIVWPDDRALVIAEHGYIIGSHWLAFVDPATLPAYPFALRDERVAGITQAIRAEGHIPYRHGAPEPYAVRIAHRENGTSAIVYADGTVRRTWVDGTVSVEPAYA